MCKVLVLALKGCLYWTLWGVKLNETRVAFSILGAVRMTQETSLSVACSSLSIKIKEMKTNMDNLAANFFYEKQKNPETETKKQRPTK